MSLFPYHFLALIFSDIVLTILPTARHMHPQLSTTYVFPQVVGFCGAYIYSLFSLPSSIPVYLPIHFLGCDDIHDAWCIEKSPAIHLKRAHVRGFGTSLRRRWQCMRGTAHLGCGERA
jgi:hypothetical protein